MDENKFQIKETKSREFLVAVVKRVEDYASELQKEASYCNEVDPEAEELKIAIKYYKLGLTKEIPPEWYKQMLQVEREADPEYQEYLRLKKKFND